MRRLDDTNSDKHSFHPPDSSFNPPSLIPMQDTCVHLDTGKMPQQQHKDT